MFGSSSKQRQRASLSIERDYDPSLPDFMADGGQLTQAVLNLVRNAWQACGDGRIDYAQDARASDSSPSAETDTNWSARFRSVTMDPVFPKTCCRAFSFQWSQATLRAQVWACPSHNVLPISTVV